MQVSLTKNNLECKGDHAVVHEESQRAQRRLSVDLNRPQYIVEVGYK
jgi:23S rRNA G2445 N2-methylase RlmL